MKLEVKSVHIRFSEDPRDQISYHVSNSGVTKITIEDGMVIVKEGDNKTIGHFGNIKVKFEL